MYREKKVSLLKDVKIKKCFDEKVTELVDIARFMMTF